MKGNAVTVVCASLCLLPIYCLLRTFIQLNIPAIHNAERCLVFRQDIMSYNGENIFEQGSGASQMFNNIIP